MTWAHSFFQGRNTHSGWMKKLGGKTEGYKRRKRALTNFGFPEVLSETQITCAVFCIRVELKGTTGKEKRGAYDP